MKTLSGIWYITLVLLQLLIFFKLSAQETPMLINTEARLDNILLLKMTPEKYVEFGIKKINENLYQITKQPDDVMFSVESTGSWNLSISSADAYFTGKNDSTHKVPVDFIGLYVENTGTNWDNGLFSNMANATKDTIVYLAPEKTSLLESGVRGNIGGSSQNSFILRWKFFYEDDALKIRKFTDFDINDDNYRVGYYITLSESTANGKIDQ
ncbi:MAG: hypothetical protein M0Q51_03520 [Bacteroidales bacterium]|nr:hypothetical protein [Bacteroidales bacterium]